MKHYTVRFPLLREMMHPDDITLCMKVMELLAARSRATRAKVGCVIWHPKKRTIIGIGYNGTAAGEDNTMEMDGKTLGTVIHAEENALRKCGWWEWWAVRQSILFVTHAPCLSCAKKIQQSGIKTVYFVEPYGKADGLEYLRAYGIHVRRLLVGR